jgi:sucrose phosphorylase
LATPNDYDRVASTGMKRAINRHMWDYPTLIEELRDPDSNATQVLTTIKYRLAVRGAQKAFHPNATQFTLSLDDRLFGVWRQSVDRAQSVFALHNVSDQTVRIDPDRLNLIEGQRWRDLLNDETIRPEGGPIEFAPYQCRWISNK